MINKENIFILAFLTLIPINCFANFDISIWKYYKDLNVSNSAGIKKNNN